MLVGLGVAFAAVEAALILAGPAEPVLVALMVPFGGAVYFVVGGLAWRRRPGNGMGPLLVLGGAFMLCAGLIHVTDSALIAAGQVTQTLILALAVHLLLAFPSGRLQGRLPRILTGAAYGLSTVLEAPRWLIVPGPDSALTTLRVSEDPGLLKTFADIQHAVGWAVMAGVIYVLARRLRAAEPASRPWLVPVYAWGMLAAFGIPLSANLLGPSLGMTIVQLGVITGVPVAFALGIRLGGFARTAGLDDLGAWLGSGNRAILAALAEALGDPTVALAHRTTNGYVDATGAPVALPDPGSGRGAVEVEVHGRPVAAILYDAALIDDPETVRAAGRVVGLALEHDRLRAEIAQASDHARRSVAQDLHDGLQSRLVLLGIKASLRGDAELRHGLEVAVTELRELVARTAPAVVLERGLYPAAQELVASVPLPVELSLAGEPATLPGSLQTEAYFIVAEALTNAVKHARASELGVSLDHAGGVLRIEVRDDGVGGVVDGAGGGVRGIRERVLRLGGVVSLDSPPGAGTRLVAELPCE